MRLDELFGLAIGVIAALLVVYVLYRRAGPRDLTGSKPAFCMFPKYRFEIALPERVHSATDQIQALTRELEPMGFRPARQDDHGAVFTRGSVLGDFSIKVAKLNLRFEWPLKPITRVVIGYGVFAAFDTGDLWKFSTELKTRLSGSG